MLVPFFTDCIHGTYIVACTAIGAIVCNIMSTQDHHLLLYSPVFLLLAFLPGLMNRIELRQIRVNHKNWTCPVANLPAIHTYNYVDMYFR